MWDYLWFRLLCWTRNREDLSFPSGIPNPCVSFQWRPAAKLLHKPGDWMHNLWGSLQRKQLFFVVSLNKLADFRVPSLLPLQHLAVPKEEGVWRRKRKNTKARPWVNKLEKWFGWLIIANNCPFFRDWNLVLLFCFVCIFKLSLIWVLCLLLISRIYFFTFFWALLAMIFLPEDLLFVVKLWFNF